MKAIQRYAPPSIFIIGSVISLWFLVTNLQQLQPASYVAVLCLLYGLFLAIKVFNSGLLTKAKDLLANLTERKYFVVVSLVTIVVVGLFARLYFYFNFSYTPISDPKTFYETAQAIAAGLSVQSDGYVAQFPYLAAYNNTLGVAMRAIPDPWLATILSNTLFDVASSLVVFALLKRLLKPTSNIPVVAFGVWMLNPLNIMFSLISIPVIVVNFFIILTIFVSYLLIRRVSELNARYTLLLSVILGLVTGIGNCFRPIFLVTIIALVIVFTVMILGSKSPLRLLRLSALGLLISVVIFIGIQELYLAMVSNQLNLQAANNPSGVSLYVGSTWETLGQWKPYVSDQMAAICEKSLAEFKYDECHAELRQLAITRYQNYGIINSTYLFVSKLYHQAELQNYIYNAYQSIVGFATSKTAKVMNMYLVIYFISLFTLSTWSFYSFAKRSLSDQSANSILLFMALIMIGWFLSFSVVESAPRYSTILYPIFIVFSVLMLDNTLKNKRSSA